MKMQDAASAVVLLLAGAWWSYADPVMTWSDSFDEPNGTPLTRAGRWIVTNTPILPYSAPTDGESNIYVISNKYLYMNTGPVSNPGQAWITLQPQSGNGPVWLWLTAGMVHAEFVLQDMRCNGFGRYPQGMNQEIALYLSAGPVWRHQFQVTSDYYAIIGGMYANSSRYLYATCQNKTAYTGGNGRQYAGNGPSNLPPLPMKISTDLTSDGSVFVFTNGGLLGTTQGVIPVVRMTNVYVTLCHLMLSGSYTNMTQGETWIDSMAVAWTPEPACAIWMEALGVWIWARHHVRTVSKGRVLSTVRT